MATTLTPPRTFDHLLRMMSALREILVFADADIPRSIVDETAASFQRRA